jgi:hypothetical protein
MPDVPDEPVDDLRDGLPIGRDVWDRDDEQQPAAHEVCLDAAHGNDFIRDVQYQRERTQRVRVKQLLRKVGFTKGGVVDRV